eukprot:528064_1
MATTHALNGKLTATPYVAGFQPSSDDAKAFKEMFGGNTAAIQWAARMASYYSSEREEILAPGSSAKKAEEKKAEHVDPVPTGPVTAAPLIANFKKFAGDKSAYFMFINLEYTNDVCNFINGPEGFTPQEILPLLTNAKESLKLADAYIKIAKTSEKKQDKVREEIAKLVEDFMDKKVGGCKTLKAEDVKAKIEVDPETAELLADFLKHVATKEQKHTTPEMLKAVLAYLPEGFHPADIKSMLTDGDDCDELLETYVRLAVVPSTEKLRARTELVTFVESFAESKGIAPAEAMCF